MIISHLAASQIYVTDVTLSAGGKEVVISAHSWCNAYHTETYGPRVFFTVRRLDAVLPCNDRRVQLGSQSSPVRPMLAPTTPHLLDGAPLCRIRTLIRPSPEAACWPGTRSPCTAASCHGLHFSCFSAAAFPTQKPHLGTKEPNAMMGCSHRVAQTVMPALCRDAVVV